MIEIITALIPLVFAVVITTLLMPCWIMVCKKWHLFDSPDVRKHHCSTVPSMGGLVIFAGIFIPLLIFSPEHELLKLKFIICAALLLFFTGFFDDLLSIAPYKKLAMQIIAALIAIAGGTKITSFYGILGMYEISPWLQFPVTLIVIVLFVNAYNFIDGIDGLASMLGIIISLVLGYLFFIHGQAGFALLCFCLLGALAGFLIYNFQPAKVFMGDTGSLVTGFLLTVSAINLLNINKIFEPQTVIRPSFIFALLFIPVYDILRVSVIRLLNGTSPAAPDRNHIHHMILQQGFGHRGACTILIVFNILFILIEYLTRSFNINTFFILAICLAMLTINSRVMIFIGMLRDKFLKEPAKKIKMADQ